MKKLIAFLGILALLAPAVSQARLIDYYSEQGLALPSLKNRAVIYSQIADDTYRGSANQNNLLESYLRGGFLGATTKIKLTDTNAVTPVATSTPTANLIPIANASGTLDKWMSSFGGSGADGALSIGAGTTTTLDIASSTYLEKNYSSISIVGTLNFQRASTTGSIIVLKSSGDCVISGSILANELGSHPGNGGIGANNSNGTSGSASVDSSWILDDVGHLPDYGDYANAGTAGAGGTAATIWTNKQLYTNTSFKLNRRVLNISPGSGGAGGGAGSGGGGSGNWGGSGGAGGKGGGAILIECKGSLTFTGTINTNGGAGVNGSNYTSSGGGGGGGGGGSGGQAIILYNTLVSNSGTITVAGGNGGNGGNGGGGAASLGGGGGGAGGSRESTASGAGGDGTQGAATGVAGGTPTGGGTGGSGGTTNASGGGGGGGGGGSVGSYIVAQNFYF